ncbi:protein-tyrosine phosphatase-like protein [Xylogone sp. PMI_703]|nr:protein-tyrosine phosphatase-like protein [Xylogone sp. PMI_703]
MSLEGQSEVDLLSLATTPFFDNIPPSTLQQALSQFPFISIPGTFNTRVISQHPGQTKGLIYRSGELGHITPEGKRLLVEEYGIKTIFDLRRRDEREKRPSPEIPGVNTVWIPNSTDTHDFEKKKVVLSLNPTDFVEDHGADGYVKMYSSILDLYGIAYKQILLHLKEVETGGILFHCTAGKDRTGVLAALILGLAGAPVEAIVADYSLTRIGVEQVKDILVETLLIQTGLTIDQPGMLGICNIYAGTMTKFLSMMVSRWGGIEGYLEKELGLTPEEIESIKTKLARESHRS